MLAYYLLFGPNALVSLIVWLVILGCLAALAVWAVRYLGGPDILVKIIVVLIVLFAVLAIIDFASGGGSGSVIIHDSPRVR